MIEKFNKERMLQAVAQIEKHQSKEDELRQRIIIVRTAKKMDQRQFGDALGYDEAYISSLKNGSRMLSERFLKQISRVFLVNEYWLTSGVDEMYVGDSALEMAGKTLDRLSGAIALLYYDNNSQPEPAPEEFLAYLDKRTDKLSEILKGFYELYTRAEAHAESMLVLFRCVAAQGRHVMSSRPDIDKNRLEFESLKSNFSANRALVAKCMEIHLKNA